MIQKLFSCAFFSLILLPCFAQVSQIGHDVTIFSGDGKKFTVTFNGMKINETPSSNVVATNLNTDWVKAIIEFEDATIPPIKKNILQIKGPTNKDNHPETVVYELKEKKGEYVLRWSSTSPKKIQQTQTVIIQGQPAPAPQPGIHINTPGVNVNIAIPK